jgi:toxin HigB-1
VRIEYSDETLRRMAEDPDFAPRQWSREVIRAYRKKIQLLGAAKDERDLRQLHGLRLKDLSGKRAGTSSIRLNNQYRLVLRFRTDPEGRVVIVLELVDYH